ncbi:MAG TPA: glycosyltransferase family 39 protein [Chloroflexi bacterium]|nr:glycosyltransferase family 39 protein [Chloroflexota bacterium]
MEEPTVLDYVKARLMPWKKTGLTFPAEEPASDVEDILEPEIATPEITEVKPREPIAFPWLVMAALLLALMAQRTLEPPDRSIGLAVALYTLAGLAAVIAWFGLRQWSPPPLGEEASQPLPTTLRRTPLLIGCGLLSFAFLAFGGNQFNSFNLTLWLAGGALVMYALWIPDPDASSFGQRMRGWLTRPEWKITITPWTVMVVLSVLLVLFFRFDRLAEVPGEMFSDHAEKLLDVADVLAGEHRIFFPRNTGREAIQFYLTAAVAELFGTGLSFISLKIGTALLGVFALPFIYLLGKEIGNRWVGLFAFLLAGMAYWPNVISRVGLRFPLYPAFAAPTLYFLVRGLRRRNRNDFLLAGLFLGIGLHGYSAARFVPVVVVIAVGIYWLHSQAAGNRRQVIWALVALAFVSLIVFLPLMRYILEDTSGMFGYRALTRLGSVERPLPAPAWQILLSNLWKAWIMMFYDNGGIWVHSVVGRPALDVVTAALYFLGSVLVLARYIRSRNWLDLFLLISIPLLMMPSALSLAFPEENPSLNRTGAAIVPVFILAAIGLESLVHSLRTQMKPIPGRIAAAGVTALLLLWSGVQNYDLVMRQYDRQFMAFAWNTSEIGRVIRGFAESQGNPDSAYVVPYPHWVDTRLVGINAGYPLKDYALWPENFAATLEEPGAKLFILYPKDQDSLAQLQQLYPQGSLQVYDSVRDGKDFYMYYVPPMASDTGG